MNLPITLSRKTDLVVAGFGLLRPLVVVIVGIAFIFLRVPLKGESARFVALVAAFTLFESAVLIGIARSKRIAFVLYAVICGLSLALVSAYLIYSYVIREPGSPPSYTEIVKDCFFLFYCLQRLKSLQTPPLPPPIEA